MSNEVHSVRQYRFSDNDGLMLDANIWIFLYGPVGDPRDRRVHAYSSALQRILAARSSIFVNVVILSEFINRYARMEHMKYGVPDEDFKQFRKSPRFTPLALAITASVRSILKDAIRIDCSFAGMDVQAALAEFETGTQDFNDQMILESCKQGNLKLVTHDADFRNCGIPVITANQQLLQS